MTAILLTGMSGTGKSSVVTELVRRGFAAVDTDHGGYVEPATVDGRTEPLWREGRIGALLDGSRDAPLFVAGCVANQVRFYPRFAAVVLLSAPLEVVQRRVALRTGNPYGSTAEDRATIAEDLRLVEPLLRAAATVEIDTRAPLDDVVTGVLALAGR